MSKSLKNQKKITPSCSQMVIKEVIFALLKCLSERESEALVRRYGLRKDIVKRKKPRQTLQEIGTFYHITRERVRQIEKSAIEKIKKSAEFKKILPSVKNFVVRLLKKYNGIIERELFLEELANFSGSEPNRPAEETLLDGCTFNFILSKLLTDTVEEIGDIPELRKLWKIKSYSIDFSQKVINKLVEIVKKEGQPIEENELLKMFKKTLLYQENSKKLSNKVILALLRLSGKLEKNPFNEWGFASWDLISLKRVSDKIYYMLRKEKNALHFSQITELINKQEIDYFVAHIGTVRNILTTDIKYVLVGRGTYALAEWGAEPGTVTELIEKILQKERKPLKKEEITEKILKQRLVKEQTVFVALGNKNKFERLPNKKYRLIKGLGIRD